MVAPLPILSQQQLPEARALPRSNSCRCRVSTEVCIGEGPVGIHSTFSSLLFFKGHCLPWPRVRPHCDLVQPKVVNHLDANPVCLLLNSTEQTHTCLDWGPQLLNSRLLKLYLCSTPVHFQSSKVSPFHLFQATGGGIFSAEVRGCRNGRSCVVAQGVPGILQGR